MKTITVEITDEAENILDTYEPGKRGADGQIISEALRVYRERYHQRDEHSPRGHDAIARPHPGAKQAFSAKIRTGGRVFIALVPGLGLGFVAGVVFTLASVVLAIVLQQRP